MCSNLQVTLPSISNKFIKEYMQTLLLGEYLLNQLSLLGDVPQSYSRSSPAFALQSSTMLTHWLKMWLSYVINRLLTSKSLWRYTPEINKGIYSRVTWVL